MRARIIKEKKSWVRRFIEKNPKATTKEILAAAKIAKEKVTTKAIYGARYVVKNTIDKSSLDTSIKLIIKVQQLVEEHGIQDVSTALNFMKGFYT